MILPGLCVSLETNRDPISNKIQNQIDAQVCFLTFMHTVCDFIPTCVTHPSCTHYTLTEQNLACHTFVGFSSLLYVILKRVSFCERDMERYIEDPHMECWGDDSVSKMLVVQA